MKHFEPGYGFSKDVTSTTQEVLHIAKDTLILSPTGSKSLVAANELRSQHQHPPVLLTTKSGLAPSSGFCLHVINM